MTALDVSTLVGVRPRPGLPSDFAQMTRVTKYELLNYVRGLRFVVLMAITLVIAGILTAVTAYYRPAGLIGSGLTFFTDWWALEISSLIALAGALFGGDAIAGEFQNKTGYFLFGHPIRRSSVFLGKISAAFLASAVIVLVYAAICVVNGWYYTGVPPIQLSESVAFALVYLLGVLGFTFFFSSLFKSGAMSIIVTLVLLLFGFTLIDALVSSLANVEPWFSITYGGGVIGNILTVPYPPHIAPAAEMFRGFAPYHVTIPEGIAILVAYLILGGAGGYALFRRQDFT